MWKENLCPLRKCLRLTLLRINGKPLDVELHFATDMTDYERLRVSVLYDNTDLFMFCMATEYANTLQDLKSYWIPEVESRLNKKPSTRSILVRLNDHVREDPAALETVPNAGWGAKYMPIEERTLENYYMQGVEFIDHEEAGKLAKEMGALKYIVCKGTSSDEDIRDMMREVSYRPANRRSL
jgi:hypothetical protein